MMFYTVYKTVNLLNGEYYFGVHKTENPKDVYLGSGTYIKRAVAKCGEQNFRKEVLFTYLDAKSAFGKEDELIQSYRGRDSLCKNLRKGGSGGFDWINEKGLNGTKVARAAGVEKRRRDTFRKRWENDPAFRKKLSKNGRRALKCVSDETRKRNLLLGAKAWKGQHHTKEFRERKSQEQRGINNSQFGCRWMRKEGVVRKVARTEVERALTEGWLFGKVAPKVRQKQTRKPTLNEQAPKGTRWCSSHKQFLDVQLFHGKYKYCKACRRTQRIIRRQRLEHW